MKIIIGLGNYGKQYESTYHNVGFMSVDAFAKKHGGEFFAKNKLKGEICELWLNGEKVILVKPLTYMNLSGECVGLVVNFYKANLGDIVVIYDDLDLDIGSVRLRQNGSAGTHNGMRNIVSIIGSDFPRFRIGTKNTNPNIKTIDYVLSKISAENLDKINQTIGLSCDFISEFVGGVSMEKLMNKFNTKKQ